MSSLPIQAYPRPCLSGQGSSHSMSLFEVLCTGADCHPPAWPLILFSRSLWGMHKLPFLLNTPLAWPHLLRAGKTSVRWACRSCTEPSTGQVLRKCLLDTLEWEAMPDQWCLKFLSYRGYILSRETVDCISASHHLHGRLGWQFLFESNLLGIFLTSSHVIKPWPAVEYHQKKDRLHKHTMNLNLYIHICPNIFHAKTFPFPGINKCAKEMPAYHVK